MQADQVNLRNKTTPSLESEERTADSLIEHLLPTYPELLDCHLLIIEPTNTMARMLDGSQTFQVRTWAEYRPPAGAEVPSEIGTAPLSFHILLIDPEGIPRKVALPDQMATRLSRHLAEGPLQDPFDCESLAYYLNGAGYKYRTAQWSDDWRVSQLSESRLRNLEAGETVVLCSLKVSAGKTAIVPYHFAVHLAEGLFISKFGTAGGLIIADLPAMLRSFGGESVLLLQLRHDGGTTSDLSGSYLECTN